MTSSMRDLFPFGDIDSDVVGRVADRFDVSSVEEVVAGFALGRAVVELLDTMLSFLGDLGLSPARWRVLVALLFQSEASASTIGELAMHLQVREPTVTATVDRLEAEGLVRRQRDTADGRRVRVSLTPEGRGMIARVVPVISTRVTGLMSAIGSPPQVEEMADRISQGVSHWQRAAS